MAAAGFPWPEEYDQFRVGEAQQTFYQPPSIKTLEKWRGEAPAGFEFTLKAWQLITPEAKSPTCRRLKLPWPPTKLALCGSFKATEEVA